MADIVSGAVLQPVFDLLADPDIVNLILEISFHKDPGRVFPPSSGTTVKLLHKFATGYNERITSVSKDTLGTDASTPSNSFPSISAASNGLVFHFEKSTSLVCIYAVLEGGGKHKSTPVLPLDRSVVE